VNTQNAPPYVIQASPRRVEVWTCSAVPFEKSSTRPWKPDLVRELKMATSALEGTDAISGIYATTSEGLSDTENALFTNPSSAAFPANTGAIRWERDPKAPPAPPAPIANRAAEMHYYRYERRSELHVWEPSTRLATWSRIPRQLSGDTARPMWLAIRQALVDGAVLVETWDVPDGTPFGIRLTVHAPPGGPRSAVAASEPLVDGALSGLQAGEPHQHAAMIAYALGAKLGVDSDQLLELVRERVAVLPGSPFRLRHGGVQLSPCDHLCVVGEVSLVTDPTITTVETSGQVFLVEPKEAGRSQPVGASLLGFLGARIANDIELSEVANEWTGSLPPDHVVGSPDVIRTSRSDGSYVEAYAVPGPEIGELLAEYGTSRLLAEATAKKAIIELHSETEAGTCATCCTFALDGTMIPVRFPCRTLLALALPYVRMHDFEGMRRIYGW
jgi:hypothetical protein